MRPLGVPPAGIPGISRYECRALVWSIPGGSPTDRELRSCGAKSIDNTFPRVAYNLSFPPPLRAYVTAEDSGIQNQSDTTVRLHVSHSNLKQTRMQEIRLDRHMTISTLKHKLISHIGTNPSAMVLQLFDEVGNLIASGMEDNKKLGFYSPADGWRVHVIDTDPTSASANGWLEDVSKVRHPCLATGVDALALTCPAPAVRLRALEATTCPANAHALPHPPRPRAQVEKYVMSNEEYNKR